MEINSISSVIAGTGLSGRVSQAPPLASTSAEIAGALGRAAVTGNAANAVRTTGREQAEPGRAATSLERAVQESVDKLNEFIRPYVTSLQFSVDQDLGKLVVKIMDTETKEVIKQIPSEEVLALTKALSRVEGLLVQQMA